VTKFNGILWLEISNQRNEAVKYQIKKNSVQETLIIPVYGRKMCSMLFPNLFRDEIAIELMDKIDYDFSELERKSKSVMQQFGFLEVVMHQNDLAWEVRDYLKKHLRASINKYT